MSRINVGNNVTWNGLPCDVMAVDEAKGTCVVRYNEPNSDTYYNEDVPLSEVVLAIEAEDVMTFLRQDNEALAQAGLSEGDRVEIFLNILQGSSDITKSLLDELCKNYSVSLEAIVNPREYTIDEQIAFVKECSENEIADAVVATLERVKTEHPPITPLCLEVFKEAYAHGMGHRCPQLIETVIKDYLAGFPYGTDPDVIKIVDAYATVAYYIQGMKRK